MIAGFFGKAKKFFSLDDELDSNQLDEPARPRASSARQSAGPIYFEPQEFGKI